MDTMPTFIKNQQKSGLRAHFFKGIKDSFCFIPVQIWNHNFTDAELYAQYDLSDAECKIIEDAIKVMTFVGGIND